MIDVLNIGLRSGVVLRQLVGGGAHSPNPKGPGYMNKARLRGLYYMGVVKNRWYGETSRGGSETGFLWKWLLCALKLIKETRFLVRWLSTTCDHTLFDRPCDRLIGYPVLPRLTFGLRTVRDRG
ncbi:MAG: hypothetical protein AB4352_28425 [Hormoscilla sp.]